MLIRFINFIKGLFTKAPKPEAQISLPEPVTNYQPFPVARLGKVRYATQAESHMISRAVDILSAALKKPLFKELVLKARFTETNGLTNEGIYALLCKDILIMNVEMFTGNWRQNHLWHTVGLDVGDGFVYANRYFVKDEKKLASLMLHEKCHGLGFSHNSTKATSVPYTMNEIIEECMNGL